MAPLGTHL